MLDSHLKRLRRFYEMIKWKTRRQAVNRVLLKSSRVTGPAAEAIAEAARGLVPVDTGALKKSIESSTRRGSRGLQEGKVTVGAKYALHVEYGTSKMAAQPYLRPALTKVKGRKLK